MIDYTPPLKDIQYALRLAGLDDVLALDAYEGIDRDMIEQVVTEGGNFARDVLAPLNVPGDRQGCRVVDKAVEVTDGFADAYQQFVANGWPALAAPAEHGGMRAAGNRGARRVRDVECREHGVCAMPDADGRCCQCGAGARVRCVEGDLPRETRQRRVVGDDGPDRAAGRIRPRGADHQGGQGWRSVPAVWHEDLHHLGRSPDGRQHGAPRAGQG